MGRVYDIDELLEEVVTLPSLPDTVAQIMRMVDEPDCSLGEVARAISSDPAIALKALRLVNSAYYGLGQEVKTVEHAVVLLGIKVIKNLALTATVFDTLGQMENRFLQHSVACAMATRVCVEEHPLPAGVVSGDEAFVFGLLHDIGKVILDTYLQDEFKRVQQVVRERNIPWYLAEREIIGVDHAMLGARLAEKWKLSRHLVGAIAGHHDLDRAPDADTRILAATLAVADLLCAASGMPSYDDPLHPLPDSVWRTAAFDHACLHRVAARFFAALPDIRELVHLAA